MVLAEHVQSIMGWTPNPQDVMSGFGAGGDVANGSFEQVAPFGGWGWRYFDDPGVSRAQDPAGAYDGDYYLRLSDGAHSQQTNPAFSGETYTITAWMRGASNGDQVDITADFRNQGMGAGEVSPIVAFRETRTLTTNWQEYSMSATAPVGGNPVYATRVTFTAGPGDNVDIDAVAMSSTSTTPDTDPPTPDPMTWASIPAAVGDTSITMTAMTASDPSGAEYYFACISGGGNDSGWQDGTAYTDTGLQPDTPYSYAVKARDKSSNLNETDWSSTESATTTGGSCVPNSMQVAGILPGTVKGSKGRKYGHATVTIQDNCGNTVSGAEVSGTFTGDFNETVIETTGGTGVATFTTATQTRKPAFEFCVDSVTGSMQYEPGDNVETCDSL
jgi:hypothetical protein